MKWISSLFSRYWRNLHFLLILTLSLALTFGGTVVTSRVSTVAVYGFHFPFSIIKNRINDLSSVHDENQRLQQSLVEATTRLTQLDEAAKENLRLRAVLGFEPPAGYSLIPAKVISVTGQSIPIAASINRGKFDSVLVDQPIVNEQGLIGRVHTSFAGISTVQLLTDPSNRVAVRIAESREMGIIKYRTDEGMILDNFPIQGNIKPGDRILSSGLGRVYPPGLLVGTVETVVRPEEEPFCEVTVRPAANFSSLEELFILKVVEP